MRMLSEGARRFSRRGFLAALGAGGGSAGLALLAACREGSGAAPSGGLDRLREAPNWVGPTAAPTAPSESARGPSPAASGPAAPPTESAGGPRAAPGGGKPFAGQTVAIQVAVPALAQAIRDRVQPGFERAHGLTLVVEEASTAEQIARLRAGRDDPRHIVMGLDDFAVGMARAEGLISRLDPKQVPNLAEVYPEYLLEDGFGVGQAANWVAVWYNVERLKKAPTSCAAFWEPRYRGRVAVPSIRIMPGFQWLVMSAALAGGKGPAEAQYDVEPGFEQWRQLKPNLHSTYDSFYAVTSLLAQGEIWMAFGHGRAVHPLIMKGAPIERAVVKENPFLGLNALVLVKHPTREPLGNDLVDRLLAADFQAELARLAGSGPTNARAQAPAELTGLLPGGRDDVSRMIRLDWNYVNSHRTAWADRWDREVAG